MICYSHNLDVPLFLMAIYAKGAQADLLVAQRKALAKQIDALKQDWKKKRKK